MLEGLRQGLASAGFARRAVLTEGNLTHLRAIVAVKTASGPFATEGCLSV
jgi:hypothetical protein